MLSLCGLSFILISLLLNAHRRIISSLSSFPKLGFLPSNLISSYFDCLHELDTFKFWTHPSSRDVHKKLVN